MKKMSMLVVLLVSLSVLSSGCGFVLNSIKSSPLQNVLLGKDHCVKEAWGKLCTRLNFSGTAGGSKLKIDGVVADPLQKISLKNRYTPPGGFLPTFDLPRLSGILYHNTGVFYIPMYLTISGVGTKVGTLRVNLSGHTRWISGNPVYM